MVYEDKRYRTKQKKEPKFPSARPKPSDNSQSFSITAPLVVCTRHKCEREKKNPNAKRTATCLGRRSNHRNSGLILHALYSHAPYPLLLLAGAGWWPETVTAALTGTVSQPMPLVIKM